MNQQPRALFLGLSTLDVTQLVERLPSPDEKVRAIDVSLAAGGPAANAAIAFAGLGGHARFLTRLGKDPAGILAETDLAAHQVETLNYADNTTVGTTTASILITQSTGQRAVVSAADKGRSTSKVRESTVQPVKVLDDFKPDVIVVDSYETDISLPIMEEAQNRSIPVVLDCGGKKAYTECQLEFVSCAIVSRNYLYQSIAAIADDIRRFNVPFGAITDGPHPVAYWTPDSSELGSHPIAPAANVIDTLGAGDFFHGAAAFEIARRGLLVSSFSHILDFASRVASLSIQQFGSRTWLKTLRQDLQQT